MPYIERNEHNKIKGVFALLQPGHAEEYLPDDDLEVVAYLNPPPDLSTTLSSIFDAQSVELRAQFAPLRAAIRLELDLGHVDVAREIIVQANIPAELEPIRQQLLDQFPLE